MNDGFVNIECTHNNMDRYIARKSIKESLQLALGKFSGHLLDIGCGKMPYKKFICDNATVSKYTGLDIETALIYDPNSKPDFFWNGKTMPFENNQFNCALATEVLEHCPDPEIVLKETYRVLKKDGVLFFTVPFLWTLHEVPNDEYRYTPFSIKRHLENSGFKNIEIKALGGWHASFAQMIGLWVRRSPMSKHKRKFLSRVLFPIYKYLLKKGRKNKVKFVEGQMITGLYGFAYK